MTIDALYAFIRERGNVWRPFSVERLSCCGAELEVKMGGYLFRHATWCQWLPRNGFVSR